MYCYGTIFPWLNLPLAAALADTCCSRSRRYVVVVGIAVGVAMQLWLTFFPIIYMGYLQYYKCYGLCYYVSCTA